MNKILTQENFEALLLWLSPNRDEAGKKYEKIRQALLRFFHYKGCENADDLADETINRVVGKLDSLDFSPGNKPITIFYGFANNVYLEDFKNRKQQVSLEDVKNLRVENKEFDEREQFLEKCLENLSESEKNLVVEYYLGDKRQKFDNRRHLAESQNLSMGAMHIKLHRLRKKLRNCIEKRLEKNNL